MTQNIQRGKTTRRGENRKGNLTRGSIRGKEKGVKASRRKGERARNKKRGKRRVRQARGSVNGFEE